MIAITKTNEKQKPVPNNYFQKILQLIFNTCRQSLSSQISKTDGKIDKYASITEKQGLQLSHFSTPLTVNLSLYINIDKFTAYQTANL